MPLPTISCNVVDRRSGLPAVGVRVLLRCLRPILPNSEFQGKTNAEGYLFEWSGCSVPDITLLHFIFSNNSLETMTWQMGFLTADYFDRPRYTCADVNFVLSNGQKAMHITVFADINGYGTWIEPLKEHMQRTSAESGPVNVMQQPIARPKREYQKLSEDQNKALIEHFVDEHYPGQTAYRRLSDDLNLTPHQTMKWFQRRRAQDRRAQKLEKRSMLQHETTLDTGTGVSAAAMEIVDEETVEAEATEPSAEDYSGQESDVDMVSTTFVKLDGKVVRRSGRQGKKGGK